MNMVKQIEMKKCLICGYYYAAFLRDCPAKCQPLPEQVSAKNDTPNSDDKNQNQNVQQ